MSEQFTPGWPWLDRPTAVPKQTSITTEEALRMAGGCDIDNFPIRAAALRSLAAERDALRAHAVKWAGIAGKLIAERDQLIGVLQIAVEKSGDMETPPAWVDGACSLLNRGFLKVDRAALGEKK